MRRINNPQINYNYQNDRNSYPNRTDAERNALHIQAPRVSLYDQVLGQNANNVVSRKLTAAEKRILRIRRRKFNEENVSNTTKTKKSDSLPMPIFNNSVNNNNHHIIEFPQIDEQAVHIRDARLSGPGQNRPSGFELHHLDELENQRPSSPRGNFLFGEPSNLMANALRKMNQNKKALKRTKGGKFEQKEEIKENKIKQKKSDKNRDQNNPNNSRYYMNASYAPNLLGPYGREGEAHIPLAQSDATTLITNQSIPFAPENGRILEEDQHSNDNYIIKERNSNKRTLYKRGEAPKAGHLYLQDPEPKKPRQSRKKRIIDRIQVQESQDILYNPNNIPELPLVNFNNRNIPDDISYQSGVEFQPPAGWSLRRNNDRIIPDDISYQSDREFIPPNGWTLRNPIPQLPISNNHRSIFSHFLRDVLYNDDEYKYWENQDNPERTNTNNAGNIFNFHNKEMLEEDENYENLENIDKSEYIPQIEENKEEEERKRKKQEKENEMSALRSRKAIETFEENVRRHTERNKKKNNEDKFDNLKNPSLYGIDNNTNEFYEASIAALKEEEAANNFRKLQLERDRIDLQEQTFLNRKREREQLQLEEEEKKEQDRLKLLINQNKINRTLIKPQLKLLKPQYKLKPNYGDAYPGDNDPNSDIDKNKYLLKLRERKYKLNTNIKRNKDSIFKGPRINRFNPPDPDPDPDESNSSFSRRSSISSINASLPRIPSLNNSVPKIPSIQNPIIPNLSISSNNLRPNFNPDPSDDNDPSSSSSSASSIKSISTRKSQKSASSINSIINSIIPRKNNRPSVPSSPSFSSQPSSNVNSSRNSFKRRIPRLLIPPVPAFKESEIINSNKELSKEKYVKPDIHPTNITNLFDNILLSNRSGNKSRSKSKSSISSNRDSRGRRGRDGTIINIEPNFDHPPSRPSSIGRLSNISSIPKLINPASNNTSSFSPNYSSFIKPKNKKAIYYINKPSIHTEEEFKNAFGKARGKHPILEYLKLIKK